MTSTLWTTEQIGQLSSNVTYNDPTRLYNDPGTQYGGVVNTVWTIQDGGQ